MRLIHSPVSMFSRASEIRPWIEILERGRTEPVDEPADLATIEYHLANARKWLAEAEEREQATAAAPGRKRSA